MHNTSLRPVRWAIWQVTQQAVHRGLSVTAPSQSYQQIYDDERYAFRVCWHCCAISGDGIVGVDPCAAIEKPLIAKVEDGNVRVSGAFGLFRPDILEIVAVHRSGKTGSVHVVGPAGPFAACLIDELIPFKSSFSGVALRLRDMEGKPLGTASGTLTA